ncbi:MAG: hypothetical protein PHC98_09035, partial [Syntrophotalea acetylenica]|nr:hypothetical protein [Syntrophotalea acetylenica]
MYLLQFDQKTQVPLNPLRGPNQCVIDRIGSFRHGPRTPECQHPENGYRQSRHPRSSLHTPLHGIFVFIYRIPHNNRPSNNM